MPQMAAMAGFRVISERTMRQEDRKVKGLGILRACHALSDLSAQGWLG
jgi:hypothetical protein